MDHRVYDCTMYVIGFFYCFILRQFESQTKNKFDFCLCSEEEDQGELRAEEEEEIDVDSSVDVPQATGGFFFFSLPKSSPLSGNIYSSL